MFRSESGRSRQAFGLCSEHPEIEFELRQVHADLLKARLSSRSKQKVSHFTQDDQPPALAIVEALAHLPELSQLVSGNETDL